MPDQPSAPAPDRSAAAAEPTRGPRSERRREDGQGLDALSWITIFLAVSAGLALAAMLLTKLIVGGGEIWPWFTRYALVALPLFVVMLFILLLRNAVRRARA